MISEEVLLLLLLSEVVFFRINIHQCFKKMVSSSVGEYIRHFVTQVVSSWTATRERSLQGQRKPSEELSNLC